MEDLVTAFPDGAFYRGKAVLVTGHTGFKGGWLAAWLKELGARVTGFSLAPDTEPSFFEAARVADGMSSSFGDLREAEGVSRTVTESQPEIVFHLAAQSLVRRSFRHPIDTYATNVMGTAHLLEAVRHTPSVRAVVVVTSDKCYENREWVWGYRENDPMGGHDPYSSSKGCAEIVTAAYRRSFFEPDGGAAVASARAGNVIGGGDWAEDRLVPDIARALAADSAVVLRNPGAVRPWQHVLEPVRGYLVLGERLCKGDADAASAWNFGPRDEDAVPVSEVAQRFVERWGRGEIRTNERSDAFHEAHLLRLDCSRARHRLGWHPVLTLAESIDLTIDWYRAFHADAAGAPEITREQIEGYAKQCSTR